MIDGWVDDARNGDLDDKAAWSDVTDDEIRAALIEMLSPEGRAEYANETAGPCEFALEFAEANDIAHEIDGNEESDRWDMSESPVAIVLVVVEKPEIP